MSSSVVEASADGAEVALHEACAQVGLDGADAELVRHGTNSVYRLRGEPVIVRVAPGRIGLDAVRRQVQVARWLAEQGVPAVRVVDVDQPVPVADRYVTFWESVADGAAGDHGQYGSTAELGRVLRQLHAMDIPPDLELPQLRPMLRAWTALETLTELDPADRIFLSRRCEELDQQYAALSFVLPTGVIHGDANVGNLLRTAAGGVVLSDLDGFSVGPREWDLVLTAIYYDRYGWHTEQEYAVFVESYGFDLRTWPGYGVLADVRELLMVLWLAGKAGGDEASSEELARRLESLHTGEGRRSWQPL